MKTSSPLFHVALLMGLSLPAASHAAEEPPAFKDSPQEYGLVFDRPYKFGDQAKLQARSGDKVLAAAESDYVLEREKAYSKTGAYPAGDDAAVAALLKGKGAVHLANGTKVQFLQLFGKMTQGGMVAAAQVRVLAGPGKGQVAFVGRPECFEVETFALKAGDEGVLGKGRLSPEELEVPVVGEVAAYNALLKTWRDGGPLQENGPARGAASVWFQGAGAKVRVEAVACSPDRTAHYGLAGPAVKVELLDGPDRGKIGWTFPESILPTPAKKPGGPAKAASDRWVLSRSDEGGFVVELPEPAGRAGSQPGDGGKVDYLSYRARGVEMLVAAVHGDVEIVGNERGGALDQARDRIAAKFAGGARAVGQSEGKLGPLRGREFELHMKKAEMHGRGKAFAVGKTVYIALVAYVLNEQQQAPRGVLRFLNSFAPSQAGTTGK